MSKTILITGATKNIGLFTASLLAEPGDQIFLHGWNKAKCEAAMNGVFCSPDQTHGNMFIRMLDSLTEEIIKA